MKNYDDKKLYIVAGISGSGKTTWIQNAVRFLQNKKYSVAGILSPGVWENNKKIAINCVELTNNTVMEFANKKIKESNSHKCKWMFNKETIKSSNLYLDSIKNCDYFIVDEIGPLELEDNKGFQTALKVLDEQRFVNNIVAVRTKLFNNFVERYRSKYHVIVIKNFKDFDLSNLIDK